MPYLIMTTYVKYLVIKETIVRQYDTQLWLVGMIDTRAVEVSPRWFLADNVSPRKNTIASRDQYQHESEKI